MVLGPSRGRPQHLSKGLSTGNPGLRAWVWVRSKHQAWQALTLGASEWDWSTFGGGDTLKKVSLSSDDRLTSRNVLLLPKEKPPTDVL
jgi:hypothetical protein